MNIEIQFVNTRKIDSVEELIRQKLKDLSAKYDYITNAAVFIKEEKHPNERDHVCEIRLSVPGPQLFASSHETLFEKAVVNTIEDLERQLKKHKEKMQGY